MKEELEEVRKKRKKRKEGRYQEIIEGLRY